MWLSATPGRNRRRRRARFGARMTTELRACALIAVAAVGVAPTACRAEPVAITIGPIAGTLAPDRHLADYRWDTTVRAVWGAAGRADLGRVGGGVRVWRASTTQSLGIPGESASPRVHLTGTEVTGETRLASLAGVRLLACGSAGLLRIAWSPDAVSVGDGTGGTLEVGFPPVTEWTGGAGLGLRRAIAGGLEAGVSVERTWFRLDTSHRAGTRIVTERETFGNWTARVEITHRILQI